MTAIAEKEAVARALGLTYGQLVAREWMQQEACFPARPTTRAARSRESRPDRPCLLCGSIMRHARPGRKYCCTYCRERAYDLRKGSAQKGV